MKPERRLDGLFKIVFIFLLTIIAVALLDIVINIRLNNTNSVSAYPSNPAKEQSYSISIPSHESVVLKQGDTETNISIYNPYEKDCSLIVNYN